PERSALATCRVRVAGPPSRRRFIRDVRRVRRRFPTNPGATMSFHRIILNLCLSSGLALFASACPSSEDDGGGEDDSYTPVSAGNTSSPGTGTGATSAATDAGTGTGGAGTDTEAASNGTTDNTDPGGETDPDVDTSAGPTTEGPNTSLETSAATSDGDTPSDETAEDAGEEPLPEPEPVLPTFLPLCEVDEDCPEEGDICGSHGFCASPCETAQDCISGLSCLSVGYCVPVCGLQNPCPPRCPAGCTGDECPNGCPENCAGRSCPEELGICQVETDERLGNGPVCAAPE